MRSKVLTTTLSLFSRLATELGDSENNKTAAKAGGSNSAFKVTVP